MNKIEIQKFIKEKKELYDILLDFIESQNDILIEYQIFIDNIEIKEINKNRNEFLEFLLLIVSISKNHHRDRLFYEKIEKILIFFEERIKQTFSKYEIFKIFQSSKRLLLFIFTNKVINANDFVSEILTKSDKKYQLYFYPEIKPFISEEVKERIENEFLNCGFNDMDNFDTYRKEGENESYICKLIRNDSIEDFVTYVNKTNLSLSKTTIKPSIFETNSFLIKNKETALIEYSSFFGSIQIFNFLKLNNVELKPLLWLYAIHGRNAELIHIIEELHIEPKDDSYEECLKEAIKCHHNDFVDYINDNLLDQDVEQDNIEINYDENTISYSFHYYNYKYFPINFSNKFIFYYACQYNHFQIVELLLKNKRIKINERIV